MSLKTKIFNLWNRLSQKDKFLSLLFLAFTLIGINKTIVFGLNKISDIKPRTGGVMIYGTFEQPKLINPVVSQNNDIDEEIINMVFNGLVKEDGKNNYVNDLTSEINVNSDKTVFDITLKDNVYWHDGKKLTADDVIYTIGLIKNSDLNSPYKAIFKDVRVEKLGDEMVKFVLPYSQNNFVNNLTVKIIPKHVWENVNLNQFTLTDLNLKPIGTGPFQFNKIYKNKDGKITSYQLKRNLKYFNNVYLNKIIINIFDSPEDTFVAFIKGKVDMIKEISPYQKELIKNKNKITINRLILPRYYAIFLNQKNNLFKNTAITKALEKSLNKKDIVSRVFFNEAEVLNGPISSSFTGYDTSLNKDRYNISEAKNLLLSAGYKDKDTNSVLYKTTKGVKSELEFTLLVPSNSELINLANMIKGEWLKIGIKANLNIVPLDDIYSDYIKNRNYDAILFGETYTIKPDLYFFWHSSQVSAPGLNLSNYQNQTLDNLLETNRNLDEEKTGDNLIKIQTELDKTNPAIFLNNPYYLTAFYKKIHLNGKQSYSSATSLFADSMNWYVYTKRVMK